MSKLQGAGRPRPVNTTARTVTHYSAASYSYAPGKRAFRQSATRPQSGGAIASAVTTRKVDPIVRPRPTVWSWS